MLNITIDEGLSAILPKIALGVVQSQVQVSKFNNNLWEIIDQRVLQISSMQNISTLNNIAEIKAIRDGYKMLGKDSTRYRGSAEALVRRIIQGKGLYKINTVVDINNLVSIESMHSIGSYDLSHIDQPISFRIGKFGEEYKGIKKEMINISRLPVFSDISGPFGSPTSDSERAMITESTNNIMVAIISFTGKDFLKKHLDRISDLLICFACTTRNQIETQIV